MATKIVTKNSSTASAVPTASDLVQGELAVNVADKRLFTEDNGGSIVELGTNPSTIDINAGTIDGAVIGGTTPAAITGSTVTSTGNIVVAGTVDGRDVATDGTKLDGVEAGADVTDTTNVTAAGALMDSEVTNLAQVKAFDSADYATAAQGTTADAALPKAGGALTGAVTTNSTFDGRDVATDGTKLDGIEASADVTDTTNVTAAGALMDSEVTNLAQVKAFDSADYATAAQGAAADAALPKAGGAMTGAITTNSTFDGRDVATDGTKLDGIEASADVTDTANVTAAGALMDSELTSIASVKALNQGVATTDSPAFAGLTVDTTTLAVDSTNNRVGIGTSSPASNLHVNSADTTAVLQITNSATGSAETDGFHISVGSGGFTSFDVKENTGMSFLTGGTERVRFSSGGIFLIGRTATGILAEEAGFMLKPDGLLLTAKDGTAEQTHVEFVNNAAVTAARVGTIKTSGSTTSYNTSSDYRLKTDAQPMTGATARLKELNPVNFEWISDGTRVDGFLAHEAQEVVPECVSGEKDAMQEDEYEVTPAVLDEEGNTVEEAVMGTRTIPDYQGIDQSKLVPLLVATIQELEARITQLENS